MIKQHPGNVPVTLCLVDQAGRRVLVEAGRGMRINPEMPFIEAAEKLLGRASVRLACRDNVYLDYKPRVFRGYDAKRDDRPGDSKYYPSPDSRVDSGAKSAASGAFATSWHSTINYIDTHPAVPSHLWLSSKIVTILHER